MAVSIAYKTDMQLIYDCHIWKDDLETLQQQLMAKETRNETEFAVVPLLNGGTATVDLSEVLTITANPYGEGDDTTIEVEYIYDED